MKYIIYFFSFFLILVSCKQNESKNHITATTKLENKVKTSLKITPISHASAVLEFNNTTIYLDPTGGSKAFSNFRKPNYIVITDIHGDHLNLKTLQALDLKETTIIAPKAVADKIPTLQKKKLIILNNGETKSTSNFKIDAIPMYNLREEALKFHPKGRGNGYVFTINNKRIYFSGDTEDILEMRNLKNIDKAFICMNLPYTMTVESAADAVLSFKPKQVYPYHYRGTNGLSDVEKFKKIVTKKNPSIEVVQWNWYKQ